MNRINGILLSADDLCTFVLSMRWGDLRAMFSGMFEETGQFDHHAIDFGRLTHNEQLCAIFRFLFDKVLVEGATLLKMALYEMIQHMEYERFVNFMRQSRHMSCLIRYFAKHVHLAYASAVSRKDLLALVLINPPPRSNNDNKTDCFCCPPPNKEEEKP